MSDAARSSGENVTYYAVGYTGLVGPIQQATALSEVFDAVQGAAAVLSLALVALMTGQIYWRRRAAAFRIEMLCGAGQVGAQLRVQGLMACSITLPMLLAFELVNRALASSAWPPPVGTSGVIAVYGAALTLQVIVTAPIMLRVRALYRSPLEGASNA
jgi:hypothetical protein